MVRQAARWARDLPPLPEVRIQMTGSGHPPAREPVVHYERDVIRTSEGFHGAGPVREVSPGVEPGKWERLLEAAGLRGTRVIRVDEHPGGRTMHIRLPAGVTWPGGLDKAATVIEVVMHLEPGAAQFYPQEMPLDFGYAFLRLREREVTRDDH